MLPPFPPAHRVRQRLNVAASTTGDDLDGNELDLIPGREKSHQRLGFDLEVLRSKRQGGPGFQVDEPQTALRVGQVSAGAARQLAAHPAVHLPAQPRNGPRIMHAVADNQPRTGSFSAPKEGGQILGGVLAVAIEGRNPFKAQLPRLRQSGPQRRAFAEISAVTNHHPAGFPGQRRCAVGRTIVHNYHEGEMLAHGGDQ